VRCVFGKTFLASRYSLEETILHLLWGLVDMFLGYNFPEIGTFVDGI